MKRIVLVFITAVLIAANAFADVGTATTNVYVRSISNGEVVGSLAKGDRVAISDKHGDWYTVCIGGKDYKVYGDFLSISTESVDDVEVIGKVRKSKNKTEADANGVIGKKKKRIKGSMFEGLAFW